MRKLLAAIVLAFTFIGAAQATPADVLPIEQCAVHLTYGAPQIAKQVVPICRAGYISYFDTRAGVPLFVAYVLTPEHASGCLGRESFEADDFVGSKPTPKDYAKSGYDIGHNANAADLAWSPQVASDARKMTNMSPQIPGFNRGIWKKLEDGTRGWAISREHPLQVYVLNEVDRKQDPMIGKNLVSVPHALGKVLIDTQTNEVQIFRFKNEASKANLNSFITSLAEFQKQTGVVLPLPATPVFSKTVWQVTLKSARAAKANVCALK